MSAVIPTRRTLAQRLARWWRIARARTALLDAEASFDALVRDELVRDDTEARWWRRDIARLRADLQRAEAS